MKRRPVRVGLTAGSLTAVVLAALWLCGVFSPAPELPPPSQALIEAWDGLDAVYVEASLDTDASAMTVSQTLTLQNRTGRAQEAAVLGITALLSLGGLWLYRYIFVHKK